MMIEVNPLSNFFGTFQIFLSTLPPTIKTLITLFFIALIIVTYSLFVWKLKDFIGKKNIFKFDLNKYNKSEHPFFTKTLASTFYFLEYILIIPFIIFFWFLVFTFFLFFLVENDVSVDTILVTSAIAVASIRMVSYIPEYGEDLARDLSK